MKRNLIFGIAVILSLQVTAQQPAKSTIGKIPPKKTGKLKNLPVTPSAVERWEPDTILYEGLTFNKEKEVYAYNEKGLVKSFLSQILTSTWANNRQVTPTYDDQNNMITQLEQIWVNKAWQNKRLVVNTYNTNRKLLTSLIQVWENNDWAKQYLYTYTYDTQGNLLTALEQFYDENKQLVNSRRGTYNYDSHKNLLTEIEQNWQKNTWINDFENVYTYNPGNKMLTALYKEWKDNKWANNRLSTYTYNERNDRMTELNQRWEGGKWKDNWKISYTYDAGYNEVVTLLQNLYDSSWFNIQHLSKYDPKGNKTEEIHQDFENKKWVNKERQTYTYDIYGNGVTATSWVWEDDMWKAREGKDQMQLPYNNKSSFIEKKEGMYSTIVAYKKIVPVADKSNTNHGKKK